MYRVVDQIGARALWSRGITGKGVNVAVIDTGVADVPALSGSDKVVAMVDLSAEAAVPEAQFADTYGHGTHMAGIIAGRDPGADPALAAAHPEWFLGVAPDAGLVSVKVGDNTGGVDVSQVIAGVDWVVDHAAELRIRVLNLSYASGSTLSYTTDPLAYAVERAWKAGIVVVVAAGNDGRGTRQLATPANDPYVMAVAATEVLSNNQVIVPWWATSGDGMRNPDLSAPGAHIDSLRAPYSRVAVEHPEGYVSETIFRGSGSSQAAAVVSGATALLLSAQPGLTPDQVKAMLKASADANLIFPKSVRFSGSGSLRIDRAAVAPRPSTAAVAQTWPPSTGTGSLEAARGAVHLVVNGTVIRGEVTVLGTPWTGVRWAGVRWAGSTWTGVRWTGGTWMGVRWTDSSWTGVRWAGVRWTGVRWAGVRWTGVRWTGAGWS
jgi:serine protease AprX